MPQKSQSIAKITLVLSLLTCLASGFFIKQSQDGSVGLKAAIQQEKSATSKIQELLTQVSTGLIAGAPAESLSSAGPELFKSLQDTAGTLGVTLTKFPADAVPAITDAVPGTQLKAMQFDISGTYKTYPEFLAFLAKITEKSVAISRLTVQEHGFDATLRLIGAGAPKG